MIDLQQLARECKEIGLSLTEQQANQFEEYAKLLMEWNEKMNLTAIKKPEEIVTKHFVDSLTLLTVLNIPVDSTLVDVGTGAGFPAIPVKILRPDLDMTLLDSLNKRLTFLAAVGEALGMENALIHARAEEAGRQESYREQYDVATARAVAHLRELAEYCLPFVKIGGLFAAMKSGEIEAEIGEAEKAIRSLGGKVEAVRRFSLGDGSGRAIVIIKKISHTSPKYPRPHAKIAKNPFI